MAAAVIITNNKNLILALIILSYRPVSYLIAQFILFYFSLATRRCLHETKQFAVHLQSLKTQNQPEHPIESHQLI